MNCEHIERLLHAHHDGELDIAATVQVDEQLAGCPRCAGLLKSLSHLSAVLSDDALCFQAPPGLRQRIHAATAQAAKTEGHVTSHQPWFRNSGWAVAAAVAIVALILAFLIPRPRADDRMIAELTESHIRSLMASHLMDVASTDQHTVKPWFTGKLGFAPPVEDLRSVGFPLLGGRLDYVGDHAVAALIYACQRHAINLFIWPAESSAFRSPHATQRNDYRIVRWSDGGMNLVAVSDLSEAKLREFAVSFCHSARQSFPP